MGLYLGYAMERVQKKISRFKCLRGQCNAVSRGNIGLSEPKRKSFLKDFSLAHEKIYIMYIFYALPMKSYKNVPIWSFAMCLSFCIN
jgi:hypothetical protein